MNDFAGKSERGAFCSRCFGLATRVAKKPLEAPSEEIGPEAGATSESRQPQLPRYCEAFLSEARYSTRSTSSCVVMPACKPAGIIESAER